ncbi:hypothetical protein GOC60_14780 [Sinorhizobium meliloti]|nr:hypothetical protein [Sinorhizobium meliloti]
MRVEVIPTKEDDGNRASLKNSGDAAIRIKLSALKPFKSVRLIGDFEIIVDEND